MPKKVKKILIALVTILIVTLAVLIASPKQYLIIDGQNNIAYGGAINTVFWEGLDSVDYETARLVNTYLKDRAADYVVLINPPSARTVLDFYNLAKVHGARLIIGDTPNEKELKAELFNSTLSNKEIKFQTNQEWKPDWKNSFY
ncbi:MAG TPA: hypothetical protein PLA38_02665 [bacterium]|jgi:hypothetical protein|nr:hypothetical protein [bacterium]HOR69357.1 hypothetical protein [bacterium]HOS98940.1 hypothetical protein [bacterium]HPD03359.1 hypothetical protein [bacterium]HPL83357.1 hypothetical protein [bacterium]